jgi:hypothetical protein
MADYRQEISRPSLDGLTVSNYNVDTSSSKGAVANAVTAALVTAAGVYGKNKARKQGEILAGQESYEEAGIAAETAKTEVESLFAKKEAEVGKPVSQDQARDLKKEVFDRVLVNYKRIEGALSRGLISSTEANARLSVLRNEALSNPLVAPYQDELDNALFKTTGGSASAFGPTASEQEAQAATKGELAAVQATEEKVTTYIRTGLAASRNQALSIIAQQAQHEANMAFFQEKKARLGVTSEEAYAASQTLATSQAASSYGKITSWVADGADAKAVPSIRLSIIQEGEQLKQAIRSSATNKDGTLLVDQETLRKQIDEVDQRTRDFSAMLEDQSATKDLVRIMAQRTAGLDYKNQDIQIELTKLVPMFMAMKDNQAASQWLWDNSININEMRTQWLAASNPLLRMIARLSPSDANKMVNEVGEKVVKGIPLNEDEQIVASETLTNKGGTGAVKESYSVDAEQTVKQLATIPFKLKDISTNLEWINLGKTEEGQVQIKAVIDGAARRAVVSNFLRTTNGKKPGDHLIPKTIKVSEREFVAGRGAKHQVWDIDTGGVPVSEEYQSEVVNAYKIGKKLPTLWENDYPTIDDWINDLFTRNLKEEGKTEE